MQYFFLKIIHLESSNYLEQSELSQGRHSWIAYLVHLSYKTEANLKEFCYYLLQLDVG